MSIERQVYSITAFTRYIKKLVEQDPKLTRLMLSGEVSNFKRHGASGHLYFSLKDQNASVNCVMFRSRAEKLRFRPENGAQVIAQGSVSVYEKNGTYQLYVERMLPEGVGAQQLALEELRARLLQEGVFPREEDKRPLPPYPEKIGLVTSDTGAVVRDMITVLQRRWPSLHILLVPAQVQGAGGAESVTVALQTLYARHDIDLIIVGRGGGSREDLWNFNDEGLVRTVAKSPVPIISAVGHETDFTLTDLAADIRAGTPSIAAELAVPDGEKLLLELIQKQHTLSERAVVILNRAEDRLKRSLHGTLLMEPNRLLQNYVFALDQRTESLMQQMQNHAEKWHHAFEKRLLALEPLNPMGIMRRGYAIAERQGALITRVGQVKPGEDFSLHLFDGTIEAKVEETHVKT